GARRWRVPVDPQAAPGVAMTAGLLGPVMASAAVLAAAGAGGFRFDPAVSWRLRALQPEGSAGSSAGVAQWVGSRPWARRLVNPRRLALGIAAAGWQVPADKLIGWKVLGGAAGFLLGVVAPMPLVAVTPLLAAAGFRALDVVMA